METVNNILFKIAETPQDFRDGERLFRQYADSIEIDLTFQGFDDELKIIDIQYNKPEGALLLAYSGKNAIACTGVRKLDNETAELKRMFVQPEYRGLKIAQKMLSLATGIARELNYRKIRLDTIPSMKQAQALYLSQGFYEIPGYRFNPFEGAIFMEKNLVLGK